MRHNSYLPVYLQLQKILGSGFRFYELFSDRKVREGAEKEARGVEPPFPWAPQFIHKYYFTHMKGRNVHLHISKTQATP